MDKDSTPRYEYEKVLQATQDLSVHEVPSVELLPSYHESMAAYADVMLHDLDGLAVLFERLQPDKRAAWSRREVTDIKLNAVLLSRQDHHYLPEVIVLTAIHKTAKYIGELGLRTAVGFRVRGSRFDIVSLGCNPELAYAANAIVTWRQHGEQKMPQVAPNNAPPQLVELTLLKPQTGNLTSSSKSSTKKNTGTKKSHLSIVK